MKVGVKERKKMADKTVNENQILPQDYGCQILLENTTLETANDATFPTDAYLVWYQLNGKQQLDLTRCSRKTSLFDMYYDKYGPDSVQRIDFGYGKTNPRIWGAKKSEKKKRK